MIKSPNDIQTILKRNIIKINDAPSSTFGYIDKRTINIMIKNIGAKPIKNNFIFSIIYPSTP